MLTASAFDADVEVSTDVPATANDLRATRAQNSPAVAVDPTDPRFVALAHRVDAPEFDCALQVSGDEGRSWMPADPVPELPEGAEKCYAPELAFDTEGRLYYLFVGLTGRANAPMGVYLTTSDDRGTTFSEPRKVLGAGNFQVRIALDPTRGERGRLHLVWLQTQEDFNLGGFSPPPNPIMAAYSDDGGATFSEPARVSEPGSQRAVAPAVALSPDGAVHVAYYDLQDDARDYQGLEGPLWDGNWSVVMASSYDGGDSFNDGVIVDDRLVPPERVMLIFTMPPPAVAADHAGRVYTAWHDARHGDWDALLSRSTDQGRTWQEPQTLGDTEPGTKGHQSLPQVSVAPDGRVDVVFYDRRHDPDNVRNDVFYAYSRDGGVTFANDTKLTSESSDTRSGQRYLISSADGLVEFGSRLGLDSREDRAVAAWTDTRVARTSPYQDVFTAQVEVSPSATPVRPVRLTAWGLAMVGAVAAWQRAGFRRGSLLPGDEW